MLEDILRILVYNPDNQSGRGIPEKRQSGTSFRKEDTISSVYPSGDLRISMTQFHNQQRER